MYDGAMDAMKRAGMFRVSGPSKLMYIGARLWGGHIEESFSHLACFSGGMLALGAATDPKLKEERKLDGLSDGANITNTCHESYIRTPTGLGKGLSQFDRPQKSFALGNNPGILFSRSRSIFYVEIH